MNTDKKIKFSIGLPAVKSYFLLKAINSVLNQTYKDFELIIFNNGVNIDIRNIVQSFDDPRIKYFESQQEGIIKDWNKCLNAAQNEYFALFSDDDIYEPEFLQEIALLINKYPDLSLYRVRTKIIDESDSVINISSSLPEFETPADFIWHRVKSYRLQYAGDFVAKTETLKSIGGFVDFPDAWCSDDATWFVLANYGGVACSNKFLFNYRESAVTVSNSGKLEKKINALNLYFDWLAKDMLPKIKIINPEDKYIIESIRKNLKIKRSVSYANSIFANTKNGWFGVFDVIIKWLRFSPKMRFNIISLFYAIAQKIIIALKRKN